MSAVAGKHPRVFFCCCIVVTIFDFVGEQKPIVVVSMWLSWFVNNQ